MSSNHVRWRDEEGDLPLSSSRPVPPSSGGADTEVLRAVRAHLLNKACRLISQSDQRRGLAPTERSMLLSLMQDLSSLCEQIETEESSMESIATVAVDDAQSAQQTRRISIGEAMGESNSVRESPADHAPVARVEEDTRAQLAAVARHLDFARSGIEEAMTPPRVLPSNWRQIINAPPSNALQPPPPSRVVNAPLPNVLQPPPPLDVASDSSPRGEAGHPRVGVRRGRTNRPSVAPAAPVATASEPVDTTTPPRSSRVILANHELSPLSPAEDLSGSFGPTELRLPPSPGLTPVSHRHARSPSEAALMHDFIEKHGASSAAQAALQLASGPRKVAITPGGVLIEWEVAPPTDDAPVLPPLSPAQPAAITNPALLSKRRVKQRAESPLKSPGIAYRSRRAGGTPVRSLDERLVVDQQAAQGASSAGLPQGRAGMRISLEMARGTLSPRVALHQ
jgi:hypothetical protein